MIEDPPTYISLSPENTQNLLTQMTCPKKSVAYHKYALEKEKRKKEVINLLWSGTEEIKTVIVTLKVRYLTNTRSL